MTHEMPVRPEAEPGAVVVDFPWTDATAAVAALDAAANELTAQIETRDEMRQSITDWDGVYRDEHDEEHFRLALALWGLVGTLVVRAGAIVTGAEEAAAQQVLNNASATREREQRARLREQREDVPVGGA